MRRKYRGLVIGDSMVMPRVEVHYNETWLYELVQHYSNIEFIDKSRRASTSDRLVSDGAGVGDKIRSSDLLEYYSPDFVITQIGITDCAPRLYKRRGFLSYLFHVSPQCVSSRIIKVLKRYRGRKEAFSYVSPERFMSNWKQYLERCERNNVQVFCILIGFPANKFILKSPNILNAIAKYNSILVELSNRFKNVRCITPLTQDEVEEMALDEFHVNSTGHSIIARKMIIEIDAFLNSITQE